MRRKNIKKTFIIAAIIGLLAFLYFTNIFDFAKEKIYQAINPAASGLYSLGANIRNGFESRTDQKELSHKVKELENDRNALLVENARLKELEEENKELRSYLEFLDEKKYSYKMAHVIAIGVEASSEREEKSIVIDKGRSEGLYPGLGVVDSRGVLVGKLEKVEEKASRVVLTTNGSCKLAATIQNMERTIGIVSGEMGLTMSMELIPQDEEVEAGDLIVTSGLEDDIPRGLLIGEVSRVNSNNNEIWKSVVIEPLADFSDLIIVSVIIP
ncbi:rod shape-determining protein MreC [Candidatus Falkowbacteria bacterium]|nr:rod shape-determining protein MreC [Candidatus Falkowbacteria bacterium]